MALRFEELLLKPQGGLLWDVDPATLDPQAHSRFLIRRVVERGNLEEVKAAWSYYGEAGFRDALLDARDLSLKTIHFFANQFGVPLESFRAYREPPENWDR